MGRAWGRGYVRSRPTRAPRWPGARPPLTPVPMPVPPAPGSMADLAEGFARPLALVLAPPASPADARGAGAGGRETGRDPDGGSPLDEAMALALQVAGFSARSLSTPEELLGLLEAGPPDTLHLVILAFRTPGLDRKVVATIRDQVPEGVRVLVASADLSLEAVMAARDARGGPLLPEPLGAEALLRYAPERSAPAGAIALPDQEGRAALPSLVAASPDMSRMLSLALDVAGADVPLLFLGEPGVGKEEVARTVHEASGRSGPFVSLNCAALPEHLLEAELLGYEKGAFPGALNRKEGRLARAAAGTLYLAEVDALAPLLQARLVQILADGRATPLGAEKSFAVRARLMAGASPGLEARARHGAFRRDLLERVGAVRLEIPPLRERSEDLVALSLHFLRLFGDRYRRGVQGITREAVRQLSVHAWPGNVRELRNVLDQAVLRSRDGWIDAEDLSLSAGSPRLSGGEGPDSGYPPTRSLAEVERDHIARVLTYTGGVIIEAARLLGIHRNTLARKVDEYGLRPVIEGDVR